MCVVCDVVRGCVVVCGAFARVCLSAFVCVRLCGMVRIRVFFFFSCLCVVCECMS